MTKVCLISDLHGCHGTMVRLLNQVAIAHPGAQLMFLGDLIDRGPNSRAVVEFAMEHKVPTCRANHDDLCLAYSEHTRRGYKAKCAREYERDIWLYNGGDYALGNWPHYRKGVREGNRIPDEVLNWMRDLPPYVISDVVDDQGRKLLASHTGYGLNADTGHWFSTLWGRHPYDGDFPEDDLYRVHGHTRTREVVVGDKVTNIDTGAAYEGYHILTAFVWPTKEIVQQAFDETPTEQRFTMVDGRVMP